MPDTCPNCDAPSVERYCPRCGQDNAHTRLDTRRVLGAALENLIGWDSALGRTARGLVTNPGGTAADYVAGRRRRYVNPARLCLLTLAAWFLATRLLDVDPMEAGNFTLQVSGDTPAAEEHLARRLQDFLRANMDVLMYLSLPLYALALRFLFRFSKRNIAECVVLVLFLESLHFFLRFLLVPLEPSAPRVAESVRLVLYAAWSIPALKVFFDVGWGGAAWRFLVGKLIHIVLTIVLFALIALPWVLLTDG